MPPAVLLALAAAAGPDDASDWRLHVEAGTDVPVQVGGRIEVEGPYRLRLWTSLGVIPRAYVSLIDAASQELGGYNDQTSELIVSSLERSLIWRLQVGWRPWADAGFAFDAGYMLATLGGDTTGAAVIGAAIGQDVNATNGGEYDIDATLHLVGGEVSYRWHLGDGFGIRAALGFVGTVASDTRVTPLGPTAPARQGLAQGLETYLDDIFTSYVFTPYLGLAGSYDLTRLF